MYYNIQASGFNVQQEYSLEAALLEAISLIRDKRHGHPKGHRQASIHSPELGDAWLNVHEKDPYKPEIRLYYKKTITNEELLALKEKLQSLEQRLILLFNQLN